MHFQGHKTVLVRPPGYVRPLSTAVHLAEAKPHSVRLLIGPEISRHLSLCRFFGWTDDNKRECCMCASAGTECFICFIAKTAGGILLLKVYLSDGNEIKYGPLGRSPWSVGVYLSVPLRQRFRVQFSLRNSSQFKIHFKSMSDVFLPKSVRKFPALLLQLLHDSQWLSRLFRDFFYGPLDEGSALVPCYCAPTSSLPRRSANSSTLQIPKT